MTALIKFIIKYWQFFAGAAVVLGLVYVAYSYIHSVYNDGVTAGIAKQAAADRQIMDKLAADHEKRAVQLEDTARRLADDLQKQTVAAGSKYQILSTKFAAKARELDTVIFDASGKVVQCPSVEIHLGTEFSDEWNQYNTELTQ